MQFKVHNTQPEQRQLVDQKNHVLNQPQADNSTPLTHGNDLQQSQQPPPQQPSTNFGYVNDLELRQKQLGRSQKINSLKSGIGLALFFALAFVFALGINRYVLQSYQVIGSSMSPTLEEQDWLVISKLGITVGNLFGNDFTPSRGDIIVFDHPAVGEDKSLIKRVIGLPGETVELNENGLTVYNDEFPNGFDPDAEYRDVLYQPDPSNLSSYSSTLFNGPIIVPEGEIFVSGDNRNPGGSLDSRGNLGTVPINNVTGVLKARLFPAGDIDFTF